MYFLPRAKRQVKYVADGQALRNILGGQRALARQVVPILNATHAAGDPPSSHEVRVSVLESSLSWCKQPAGFRPGESLVHRGLQRVVRAAAATHPFRFRPLYCGKGRSSCPGLRCQETSAGKVRWLQSGQVKGFGNCLRDRDWLLPAAACCGSLRDESVRYLVDVGVELRRCTPCDPA